MGLSIDDRVATLKNVSMFAGLPQEILEEIATLSQEMAVAAGQTILAEGEPGHDMYVIVQGRVRLDKFGRAMRELGQYQFFGETAILQQSVRTASVVAIEDTVLLRLDERPFLDLVNGRAEVMLSVITEYNTRLLKYMHDLNTLHDQLENVILPLGIALSTEDDPNVLVEKILVEAMRLCNADCGTIYLRVDEDYLRHVAIRNESRGRALGGTTGRSIHYVPLRLSR